MFTLCLSILIVVSIIGVIYFKINYSLLAALVYGLYALLVVLLWASIALTI